MNSKNTKLNDLQSLYKTSPQKVRKMALKSEDAEKQYLRYTNFVVNFANKGNLLDIGCGSGWSSNLFAHLGMNVTGVDLHDSGYEPPEKQNLKFLKGDIQKVSFPRHSFDAVSTNECLEHVPDPERALHEMVRVLKPGGHLFIVGPNLLSPGMSIKALLKYVWLQRPVSRVLYRDKTLPRHPLGNTLPEVIGFLLINVYRIFSKLISKNPKFTMRTPDLRFPFHADSDACYLLNPIDIEKFILQHPELHLVQSGAIGRSKFLKLIVSGTWICARKASK